MIFSHLEENCRICISVIKKDCETFPDSPPHLFKSDDLLDMKFRFARLSQLVFLISFPCGNQQTVIYEIQVLHNILWNCCCFEFFFFLREFCNKYCFHENDGRGYHVYKKWVISDK